MKTLFLSLLFICLAIADTPASYLNWGGGLENRQFSSENVIKRRNVDNLVLTCLKNTTGFVSDKPTLYGGIAYFTDFGATAAGSYLYAFNYTSCTYKYQVNIGTAVGLPGILTRTTPALSPENDILVIGSFPLAFAWAFRMSTGALVWSSLLNVNPNARMTQSPTIYNNVIYWGVSSLEEVTCATNRQCSFKGTFHAINLTNGAVLWTFQSVPGVQAVVDGFAGGAFVGSSPAVDPERGLVFSSNGNNYLVPQSVRDCALAGGTNCAPANNYVDTVFAFNMTTGALVWSRAFPKTPYGYDEWTVACVTPGLEAFCPVPAGPDFTIMNGPMLGVRRYRGKPTDAVFVGSKSGDVYCLDRATGATLWQKYLPPGNAGGGIVFSQAYDGKRVYFGNANYLNQNITLDDGTTTTSGYWTALDKDNGEVKWQTVEPNNNKVYGPFTVTSKLLFSGSMNNDVNNFFALNSATGEILWNVSHPGSQFAAPTIDDKCLIVGNGYSPLANPVFNVGDFKIRVYCLNPPQFGDDDIDED